MTDRNKCHDCGVSEGRIHNLSCDMERCPFCESQLLSCFCVYDLLGITDEKLYTEETAYLPPEIFKGGLTDDQIGRWLDILEARGRIPFIEYPILCARCSEQYPEFFNVPDEEWSRYIQSDKRTEVICRTCYNYIKRVIDEN